MARIDVPDGPGGEAAMIWSLRPPLGGMVERMIKGAYSQSVLPPEERELARMRIAQINDCVACADFRAPSVLEAGVAPELYDHVADYATYDGYSPRQRLVLRSATRRSSISRCASQCSWDSAALSPYSASTSPAPSTSEQ